MKLIISFTLFLFITFLTSKAGRRGGKKSSFPDISPYFAEFNPTSKQLKKLARLLKSVQKWWGIHWGRPNLILEAALIVAPGKLSQLTPDAYELLARCQNRVWAFKGRHGDPLDADEIQRAREIAERILSEKLDFERNTSKQTDEEIFDLLLSLGFVIEATPRQKLKGSRTVKGLRLLLRERGLSTKGKKDVLVDCLIEHVPPAELDSLIADVVLFRTTESGDEAIETVRDLHSQMRKAFPKAAMGTYEYFRAKRKPPKFPPGVLYDDGVVRITEEEVRQTAEELVSKQ